MPLRTKSRSTRMKEQAYYARARRRRARRTAQEIAAHRAWCGLNFFWVDCGKACRRAQDCLAADPRICFSFHWGRLDARDQTFRRDFMQAFQRLRDPDEAMIEAIALALQRREVECAASKAAAGA